MPGAADDSYGIEVAKLAGVPDAVIRRARRYLQELEAGRSAVPAQTAPPEGQVSLQDMSGAALARELTDLDLNTVTPLEALNLLYRLKKLAGGE